MGKKNTFIDLKKITTKIDVYGAYILGLLWADGHIGETNTITLSTTSPDSDIFFDILNKIGKWSLFRYVDKKHITWKDKIQINATQKEVKEWLVDKGYNNKLGPHLILNYIPKELKYIWLRGLIDGDGSFILSSSDNSGQFSITSGYKQDWSLIQALLEELNIRHKIERIKCKTGTFSRLRITSALEIEKLDKYIYFDFNINPIGLYRKREISKKLSLLGEKRKIEIQNMASKYVGIVFNKQDKRWRAYYKKKYLGSCNNEQEAIDIIIKETKSLPPIRTVR